MKELDMKKDFFDLYYKICSKQFINDDIINMGNLAIFIDKYSVKPYWNEIKDKLEQFIKYNEQNNFNIIIANGVFNYAKEKNIGNCLDYRMNKISSSYRNKKPFEFDILLDEYDYPDWFKKTIIYSQYDTEEIVLSKFLDEISKIKGFNEIILQDKNLFNIQYFIYRYFDGAMWLRYVTEMFDWTYSKNINELAWFFSKNIYEIYKKELYCGRQEGFYSNDFVANQTIIADENYKFFENLYHQNQLKLFDFIPKEIQDKIPIYKF